jgi:Carboxypeptidase regulatory-like domain
MGMGKLLMIVALCASTSLAQQTTTTLKGQVLDELGGAIVGAHVVAVNANGSEKNVTTNGEGIYSFDALMPGRYTMRASAEGFAVSENSEVDVVAGQNQQLNIILRVTIEEQKVTVTNESPALSTEPENNAGAVVLKGADLDALPDDPDDLAAALQALAGPSAGPNGGQIYIDGFTGGRLPPKSSIREIRINSNPFSAEYDRLGFGRIEILTKPGTDKFRGQGFFTFNDETLNSRNPFAPDRPPFQLRNYGGNLSGPISKKKASFFLDFEKRDIDDGALVNATILDPSLSITTLSQTVTTPSRRVTFSPRIDYQLNSHNTLVGRYSYIHSTNLTGVGGFSLPEREYDIANTEQTAQLTETAILSKTVVNETRFQFIHQTSNQNGNSIPTINVLDAFTGGGSQIGQASNTDNRWELQNNTSFSLGHQTLRVGVRLRHVTITDVSPQNFGGTWTFAGGLGTTSIERYQRTLVLQQQGLPPEQIRALGGGATQFSIAAGNPEATVSQFDFGGYVQDDWKLRPGLTLNLGLRYENQDNIKSNLNLAPRLGFAWSPGAGGQRQPTTVIRGGFGVFYDRVGENLTLQADRFNGANQQQFIVTDPEVLDLFPNVPSLPTLTAFASPVTIYQLAGDLRAPYTLQSVISVERQLPHNFTLAFSYINARALHLLRSRAINAPLPGTFVPGMPDSGVRPFGNENVFDYESTGRFNQNQFIVNIQNRFSRNSTIGAYYVLGRAKSDTDSANSFPANSYDLSNEYGRSALDVRHRFVMFGNFRAPWGVSLSPFVVAMTGRPFNITIGQDINGDTLFTERPAFSTDLTRPGVVLTRFGAFDPNPTPDEQIIPRNFGGGPGSFTVNLRLSKTFGFGNEVSSGAYPQSSRRDAAGGGPPRAILIGGGRGGGRGTDGVGGRSDGGVETGKRYNVTFSLNFQNLLNHTNAGNPIGNLSSQLFGISTSSAGNFGGFGGLNSSAYNRRIEAQIRFNF